MGGITRVDIPVLIVPIDHRLPRWKNPVFTTVAAPPVPMCLTSVPRGSSGLLSLVDCVGCANPWLFVGIENGALHTPRNNDIRHRDRSRAEIGSVFAAAFSSWPFPVLWSSCNSAKPISLKSEMWGQNDKQEDEGGSFREKGVGGWGGVGVHRGSSRCERRAQNDSKNRQRPRQLWPSFHSAGKERRLRLG